MLNFLLSSVGAIMFIISLLSLVITGLTPMTITTFISGLMILIVDLQVELKVKTK